VLDRIIIRSQARSSFRARRVPLLLIAGLPSLRIAHGCAPQVFDQGRTDAVAGSSASCGMIVT
jgi:hypothetical protein